jgi:hypothetical protein
MPFIKEDLIGDNYKWIDANSYTGSPSRRLFDRYDGNQVLFIINSIGSLSEKFSIVEGLQIEEKIIHHLPSAIKSELSVFNWLKSTH